mmetsp:Transcript_15820/g.25111  ORF Transcript_15820/g.25111 Transcript_15820/m.25111 type:complete len:283 (-) Transcript_15820:103-951(-)
MKCGWKHLVRLLGRFLNTSFTVLMCLWSMPWFCFAVCCMASDAAMPIGMAVFGVAVFANSVLLVFLLHVFEVFTEIQSLEVSLIAYCFCMGSLTLLEAYYDRTRTREEYAEIERNLFKLFQVDKRKLKNADMDGVVFHYAFISFIPAITAGFIANWFLESRYVLVCDPSISPQQSAVLCDEASGNATCCRVEFINTDVYEFFGIAFANIFAGFKIVSAVVRFLFTYYWYDGSDDDDIEINEEKIQQMVEVAVKAVSPGPPPDYPPATDADAEAGPEAGTTTN